MHPPPNLTQGTSTNNCNNSTHLIVPSIHRHSSSATMEDHPTSSPSFAPGSNNPPSKQSAASLPTHCVNPASDINARLDTQVEVRVYPCNNNNAQGKKKFTQFNVKPEVRIDTFNTVSLL
jgi:hypothetical protein